MNILEKESMRRLFISVMLLLLFTGLLLHSSAQRHCAVAEQMSFVPAVKAPEIGTTASQKEIPDWLARWELARVLSYVKRYDEAIPEYRKLIREKPDLAEARIELANVLFWQGKKEQALKELEAVPPGAMSDRARVLMADLYAAQKHYKEAESLYKMYLEKHPDDVQVRLKLADVLSWSKQYDSSLNEYRKILAVRPSDIQVRRKYAFVLIWAGKHSEAIKELRSTLKE